MASPGVEVMLGTYQRLTAATQGSVLGEAWEVSRKADLLADTHEQALRTCMDALVRCMQIPPSQGVVFRPTAHQPGTCGAVQPQTGRLVPGALAAGTAQGSEGVQPQQSSLGGGAGGRGRATLHAEHGGECAIVCHVSRSGAGGPPTLVVKGRWPELSCVSPCGVFTVGAGAGSPGAQA